MKTEIEKRKKQVGIDRLVRLDWLKQAAMLASTEKPLSEIRPILTEFLEPFFPNSAKDVRGSMDKTITILLCTWRSVPPALEAFRKAGVDLLHSLKPDRHLPVHWGMVSAVYPFWYNVAVQAGRLLKLQGFVSISQVQRRMKEQYGERETVFRRVRYVIRSFVDWNVLSEIVEKGTYGKGTVIEIDSPLSAAWLVESALHAQFKDSASLKDIFESPAFFPFKIERFSGSQLASATRRLDTIRQGLDEEMIMVGRT